MADYVDAEQNFLSYVRGLESHILEMEAALIKVYEEVKISDSNLSAGVILEIVKPAMKGAIRAGEEIRKHQESQGLRSTEGPGEVENNSSEDIERTGQEI